MKAYNEAVDLAVKQKDAGSREIFEHLLVDSEEHVDWLETQLGVISQIGLDNYLAQQLEGETK